MTIITLDVNTCEKCRALQGQVFLIDDAPVIPIHPHCHCSYCVPADGDRAEVTASGANLDELYAREGVKGYGTEGEDGAVKLYTPKGVKAAAQPVPLAQLEAKAAEGMAAFERPEIELTRAPKSARAKAELMPQAPADSAGVSSVPAIAQPETETAKTAEKLVENVFQEYRDRATPGTGAILREAGYEEGKHSAEIRDAELLLKELGGAITLRKEINKEKTPTPDYSWNGRDWEQKTTSSPTSVDNAIRQGAKQIGDNPGGIILNVENPDLDDAVIEKTIRGRFKRTTLDRLDVIIIRYGEIRSILRFMKK